MLSSDAAFHGDPGRLNPEQLLVLAAASCQLLSFLAVAARARIDVVAYEDDAVGEMPEDDRPVRITRIVLRPRITLGAAVDEDRVRRLVEVAHRECYIANSLKTEIEVNPTILLRTTAVPDFCWALLSPQSNRSQQKTESAVVGVDLQVLMGR